MSASTRLPLSPTFNFAAARALLPRLKADGISHVELSDVTELTDPNAIRAVLGGPAEFAQLLAKARQCDLRVVLDIAPSHAEIAAASAMWQDVLAYGAVSPYARFFAIPWNDDRIEVPCAVHCLDDLSVVYESGHLFVVCDAQRFALSPRTYAPVLNRLLKQFPNASWARLIAAFATLEPHARDYAETLLDELQDCADFALHIDALEPSGPFMAQLLDRQLWRLTAVAHPSHAVRLRLEDPAVFGATHRLLRELVSHDAVDGVCVQRLETFQDPGAYLDRLRKLGARHVWCEQVPNEP